MELLLQELRDATIVSIGHRMKLADFHHRKIILLHSRGGARLISEVPSAGRAEQLRGRIHQRAWQKSQRSARRVERVRADIHYL